MKVETTPLENRELKVVIEATPEETENARRTAALKLGKKVHVPGFRLGKAPYPMLLKHLDPVLLGEQTIEVFLAKAYPQILEQEKIEPYSQGRLEIVLNVNPLILEIYIPLKPVVELTDYHAIRIPYDPPVVTDEEIDQAIDQIRQQNAVIEPVERPIQDGDIVYIDLTGYRMINGEVTDEIVVEKQEIPIQTRLDEKGDEEGDGEYPFEGFSKALIGKQANDQFSVDYSFTEDNPSPSFKGMDLHFEITIKQVKTQILPELNDEFAQSAGEYSSLDDLRASVRSVLEQQAIQKYLKEYDSKVIEEVINRSSFEYPLELFERERDAYLDELSARLEHLKIDLDLYKKIRGISEEQFEEEMKQTVDKRIKSSLALIEIASKENVRIDPERVRQNIENVMQDFRQRSPEARVPQQVLENIAYKITQADMIDQVFDGAIEKLRQIAKGEEIHNNELEIENEENLSKQEVSGNEGISESEIEAASAPQSQEDFVNDKSGLEQ